MPMTNLNSKELLVGVTPGPWAVNPVNAQVDAFDGGMSLPVPVCQLLWPTDLRTEAMTEANARLIASAPRLARRVIELEEALTDARAHTVGLRHLIEAITGHDSIMAQEAIEKIDAALTIQGEG